MYVVQQYSYNFNMINIYYYLYFYKYIQILIISYNIHYIKKNVLVAEEKQLIHRNLIRSN